MSTGSSDPSRVRVIRVDALRDGSAEIPDDAIVLDMRPPAAQVDDPLEGEWDVIHCYDDDDAVRDGVLIPCDHLGIAVGGVPVGRVTRTVVYESWQRAKGQMPADGTPPDSIADEIRTLARFSRMTPDRPDGYMWVSRHARFGVHWFVRAANGTYTLMRPSDY